MLDDASTPPIWLPEGEIRLSYPQYGIDQLIGAIKFRAAKLGVIAKTETALERAHRLQRDTEMRQDRLKRLEVEGYQAAGEESELVRQELSVAVTQAAERFPSLKLEYGFEGHDVVIRTSDVNMNFYLHRTLPITESRIVIRHFNGPLILPKDRHRRMFAPGDEPQEIHKEEFYFDYQHSSGWCWHNGDQSGRHLNSNELAEKLLKELLDLEDGFQKGEIQRRRR